jgi:ubiquinone/menaquinone biosynthesis C-methylase UbiE
VPLADASCDVATSNGIFEHVYDVDVAITEQIRLLKPGGLLVIEDGNLANPVLLFHLLALYPLRTPQSLYRFGGSCLVLARRPLA